MRRLSWVAIALSLVLFAVTGSVLAYGRSLPVPPSSSRLETVGLDTCDKKFCLFNVTPGLTTWDEATHILAKYITRDEQDHFHGRIGSLDLRVEMGSNGSQIGRIDVQHSTSQSSSDSLRFSQIIQQFGMPCYVSNRGLRYGGPGNYANNAAYGNYSNDGLELVYPSFTVLVLADGDRITLNSPIGGITLAEDANLNVENRACGDSLGFMRWRGFASLWLYQQKEKDRGY